MVRMRPIVRRFGSDLLYQLSTLPASVLAFAVVVTAFSLAATAISIIVGLPLLLAIFALLRWNARLERRRTSWALGEPLGRGLPPADRQLAAAAARRRPATRRAGRTSRG